jgi:hypothetical protein
MSSAIGLTGDLSQTLCYISSWIGWSSTNPYFYMPKRTKYLIQ